MDSSLNLSRASKFSRDFSGYSFEYEYDDQFDHGIIVLSAMGIEEIYEDLAMEFSKFAISLDLTENELTSLAFLKSFHKLQSLVLDKNRHLDPRTMPTMKNLQILWLNSCNISDVSKWVDVIRVKCPKLNRLSMFNNPGSKSLVNLSSSKENAEYRDFVSRKLLKLEYLDEATVERNVNRMAGGGQFLSKLFHFNNSVENNSKDESFLETSNYTNYSELEVEELKKSSWLFKLNPE